MAANPVARKQGSAWSENSALAAKSALNRQPKGPAPGALRFGQDSGDSSSVLTLTTASKQNNTATAPYILVIKILDEIDRLSNAKDKQGKSAQQLNDTNDKISEEYVALMYAVKRAICPDAQEYTVGDMVERAITLDIIILENGLYWPNNSAHDRRAAVRAAVNISMLDKMNDILKRTPKPEQEIVIKGMAPWVVRMVRYGDGAPTPFDRLTRFTDHIDSHLIESLVNTCTKLGMKIDSDQRIKLGLSPTP